MLFSDAIPITCLLFFHFQNFKPHQHELIIRLDRNDSDMELNELGESDLLQDGMFLVSHDSILLNNGRISQSLSQMDFDKLMAILKANKALSEKKK